MAANKPTPTVVCDASPIIHLDELGCLDLLTDFVAILVLDAVRREVTQHRADALQRPGVQLTVMQTPAPDDAELEALVRALSLDAGEQAALALMHQHAGAILLTDDAAARLAAEQLGMRVHGHSGCVAARAPARPAHAETGVGAPSGIASYVHFAHPPRPVGSGNRTGTTGVWHRVVAGYWSPELVQA